MAKESTQLASTKNLSFEFGHRDVDETATLSDLMKHLDVELSKANGEPVTSRTLKRTLTFLQKSIGVDVSDKDQPLSIAILKTVRLLFLTDLNSTRNVFSLLAPPKTAADATMEFSTVTTVPRDSEASEIISRLTEILASEIEPARVRMFSKLVGDRDAHSVAEKLLLHVEQTNDVVREVLRDGLGGGDPLLAVAFDHLAQLLSAIRIEQSQDMQPQAIEAMYVYLQTLPFRHFIQHHSQHLDRTRIKLEIGDIRDDAERFCSLASHDSKWSQGPTVRVFSVNTFHQLLLECPDAMCQLVQKATGIATTIKQLRGHEDRAKRLLISYAYRSFDCTDPEAVLLTVFDVIAALASFRYQQAEGDAYKPYWHGQTDQGKDPQRLFDKGLDPDDPHQHQGVMQIYLNRFYEYQASFEGTIESHHAWMRYQTAMLHAFQSALELNDIAAVCMALSALNYVCVLNAKDCVIEHLSGDR
ncbi:hypothetical protein NJG17_10205 [Stenotrophomonas maltophilia]|uniref:hypothetical protein n=1 Tax=Stenotrophomonas maltophilia TaxID=40324 RepID=UPI00209AAC70|nr:hypothetical protein [Stenotrophomonas maltophilia]MCO7500271.1 hypothetical protein [Stenotrophomonas maltophilia]